MELVEKSSGRGSIYRRAEFVAAVSYYFETWESGASRLTDVSGTFEIPQGVFAGLAADSSNLVLEVKDGRRLPINITRLVPGELSVGFEGAGSFTPPAPTPRTPQETPAANG